MVCIYVTCMCHIYVTCTWHICGIYVTYNIMLGMFIYVAYICWPNLSHICASWCHICPIWGHLWQLIFHKEHICSHICLHIWNMYDIYWHTCSEYVAYMYHICLFRMGPAAAVISSRVNADLVGMPSFKRKTSFKRLAPNYRLNV